MDTCESEIHHHAALPAAGMGRRGEGLLPRRRARLRIPGDGAVDRRQGARHRATRSARCRPFEKGRTSDVSCACHWTVNVAAAKGHGKLYGDVYSVSPCGVFVPADSQIKSPEDLAGVPISVGYQSGSHYATIQALEQYMPARQDQPVVQRRHAVQPHGPAVRGQDPGLRAVLRAVLFRRAARLPQGHRLHLHDRHDDHRRSRPGRRAQVLPRAEARAQRDIDLRPELYTHYYKNEFPKRYPRPDGHAALGPGRAHRVRALHAGSVRGVARLDPDTASSRTTIWARRRTKARS